MGLALTDPARCCIALVVQGILNGHDIAIGIVYSVRMMGWSNCVVLDEKFATNCHIVHFHIVSHCY